MALLAHGATITVTNTNDSGAGSLRQALIDASDGDTISFAVAGTIGLTSGELLVDKSITISGPGAGSLAMDGNATSLVFHIGSGKTVTISGLTITNGTGGISNDNATLTLGNCTISGNSGVGISNGWYDYSTLTLSNCTVTGNSGDGISNFTGSGESYLQISDSVVSGNSGGGISNGAYYEGSSAGIQITNCTISGNSGVGIYNTGYNGGAGGEITNSTISDNGGGISNIGSGVGGGAGLTLSNCTISGNSSVGIYNQGGCCTSSGAGVDISNSTLSGNSGGGIANGAPQGGWIRNTVFKAGAAGENIVNYSGATIISLGYNLSSDNGGGVLTGPGDQINTDPMLGPLQDNGGPTFTHELLIGSPAIDAGDPNFTPPPFYDQRGPDFYRVMNGRIDIGSFEVQSGPPPTPTPTPTATPTPTPTPTLTATATATPTPTSTPTPTPTTTPRPHPTPRPHH
jgi:hypothetical protein